jgi:DNA-binding transcriptional LysR family regulator
VASNSVRIAPGAHLVQRSQSLISINEIDDPQKGVGVEIRDLDYFLACCKARSFTAAAREVHVVQSAMSSAIARLERELAVVLFDRSVTPVAVTDHGAALQSAAQRVLDAVQAARDEVAAVSGQVRGTVVLGCTLSTGRLDLSAVLTELRDRHPGVVVHLRQSLSGSAGNLRAVVDGAMDVALTATDAHAGADQSLRGTDPSPRGVILTPLVCEPLVFICRTDHPYSRRSSVTVADLEQESLLRFPPGWGIRDTIDRVFGACASALEIADYSLMLKLVRDRFGTTLLPASAAAAGRPDLRAVPVDDPRLQWTLSAAISADRRPSDATTSVLRALSRAAPVADGDPLDSDSNRAGGHS